MTFGLFGGVVRAGSVLSVLTVEMPSTFGCQVGNVRQNPFGPIIRPNRSIRFNRQHRIGRLRRPACQDRLGLSDRSLESANPA